MKKLILSSLSILILGIILTNISCEKLDIKNVTKINTGEVSDIGYYKATIQGTIIDVGENVREIGHCWDTISSPETDKNKQALNDDFNQGTGIYTEITNLRPGHKYYVRAYAITNNKTIYGEETTFETTKLPNFVLSFGFPATNSLWPVGKSRKIIWTTDIPGAFKLTLLKFDGGTDVDLREIATTAEGAREYDYVLPADAVTAGNYYAIRIESIDIPERYNLQGFKATDPAISMILPNANSKWNINRECTIEWNSTDVDRVDIRLLQNGNWVSDVSDAQINNNIQPWDIPQSLTPGTNYQIKVSYHDFPEIMAVSVNFEILDEASISVTAPVAADDWQAGSTHEITWTDNISENVRIELFKNNILVTEITGDTESNGIYSWTLPTTLTAGTDYTIKVSMVVDGSVVDESGQFTISAAATGSLIAYYPFNGNANDESGNSHNGTVNGATLTTDRFGNANSAYSFDGVDNKIEILHSDLLNLSSGFSFSLWVKALSWGNNGYARILSKRGTSGDDDGYDLKLNNDIVVNSFNSIVQEGTGSYKVTGPDNCIDLNNYYHLVITYDKITFKLYVNNVLVKQESTNQNIGSNIHPLTIGYYPTRPYTGIVDDIRIYDYAITETEIQNLHIENGWKGYETGMVNDYDGNSYSTVKIGNQWWMAENLKVTHYADGTAIPNVTGDAAWAALNDDNIDKAYCWYNDDEATYKATYGALYTWAAAMDGASSSTANPSGIQGVCPAGWHLPSDAEWTQLTDYLGGESVAGGKMKETGTTHWNSPNSGATNESGFSALPSGGRDYSDGSFFHISNYGHFWSSTENGNDVYTHHMGYDRVDEYSSNGSKSNGLAIRCVKD